MSSIESLGNTSYITIDGKKMTIKEYRAYKKSKDAEIQSKLSKKKQAEIRKAKREAKKKRVTEITVLPSVINDIMKNAGPIKSLAAYYDNAYRQWGTIAKDILNLPEIRQAFVLFRADAYDIVKCINDISEIAGGNEKAVFQYIQKLAWKLENTRNKMKSLYGGVISSGVLERFSDKECINGEGRRLGLKVLMNRTFKSMDKIEEAIGKISVIAKDGLNVFEYRTDVLKRAYATA